jgi:hypothetical protein
MKLRILLSLSAALFALTVMPSRLLADSFCSDPPPYQYQQCGTVAASHTFTASGSGFLNGIYGVFEGYHANFASKVSAEILNASGQVVYQGPEYRFSNQQLGIHQRIPLLSGLQLNRTFVAGDTIEFVLHVLDDPNGQQFFYSQRLGLNSDGLNHDWATTLTGAQCTDLTGPCVFMGFEDLPQQEGSDFDYNDYKMWVYGVSITSTSTQGVPEPSSILLLSSASLALAFGKLRRFF